jgi:YHS domain-containing protein
MLRCRSGKSARAAASSEHNGRTYYFCNLACKRSFDEDPDRWAAAAAGDDAS